MTRFINRKRSEGLNLREGGIIYLLKTNIKTKRKSDKLDFKKLGLFKITEKILEVIYQLDLLIRIKIYPV